MLQPGQLIDEKYRIVRLIGEGRTWSLKPGAWSLLPAAWSLLLLLSSCSLIVDVPDPRRGSDADAGADGDADADAYADADADADADVDGDADADTVPVCGNGVVEDGEECDSDAPRDCTTTCATPGALTCADCLWGPCIGVAAETCNGVDEDCDGETDEGCACASGWVREGDDLASGFTLAGVSGTGPNDVYAIGVTPFPGEVLRYDGVAWSLSSDTLGGMAIAGARDGSTVFLTTLSSVYRITGGAWEALPALPDPPACGGACSHQLRGVWAESRDIAAAVGVLRVPDPFGAFGETLDCPWLVVFDGITWRSLTCNAAVFEGPEARFDSVDGVSLSSLYAFGSASVVCSDSACDAIPGAPAGAADLWDVWVASATDVFVVMDWPTSLVHRYSGDSWSLEPVTADGLHAVWGSSPTNVFVVGHGGLILRFNGTEWSDISDPDTTTKLYGVWGSSATNVFVVGGAGDGGGGGVILHRCGGPW